MLSVQFEDARAALSFYIKSLSDPAINRGPADWLNLPTVGCFRSEMGR
jgi:hypothetical protein